MGSICGCKTFSSNTPHFFHVILDDTSRDIKVQIPKKFVMKNGEYLSKYARLKLPSGEEWQVEMTQCNGKVWFEKGWSEFSKFLSLDYGEFLVFRYEGNSVFQVCICDRTATETEYPLTMAPGMEKKGHEEDDTSIEILKDSPPYPKKREKSPSTCPPSNKKWRTIRSLKAEYARFQNDAGGSSTKQKCLERSVEHLGEFQQLKNEEKARAPSCADRFTSEEAHFKIVMQPSYIHLNIIWIPLKFLRENQIKENKHAANVTLRISTGKTWSVKFTYSMSNAKFGNGWFAFVKDNCLKVGDVCAFILMKDINLSFQVEISELRASSYCKERVREELHMLKTVRDPLKWNLTVALLARTKDLKLVGKLLNLERAANKFIPKKSLL